MANRAVDTVDAFEHGFSHLADDVKIHHVRIPGPGEPVVLVHGWPQTWYSWRKVMRDLAGHGYDVTAIDLRGSGDSTRPLHGYDSRSIAYDIHGVVEDLGLGPVHLVGHDNGGRFCYAYAAEFRTKARSLAFLESKVLGIADPEDVHREYWHFGLHGAVDLAEELVRDRERIYLSWFYRTYSHEPTVITESEIDEYVRCYTMLGGMRASFEYYRAFPESGEQNREWAKTKLTIPVLALGGSDCMREIPIESMRLVAEDVVGGVVERCGHFMPDERPDYVSASLLELFAKASAG